MKPYLHLLLFISIFFFLGCKKTKPAIDQLPPETQTGAGTFGCLVDGKAFKPKGDPFGGPIKSCAYQYINGGYYFQLHAKRDESTSTTPIVNSVSIGTDSLLIEEGKTYKLTAPKQGAVAGQYSTISLTTIINYKTTDLLEGELKITKFDETNRIVSGTFLFDAINDKGEKVQVREGSFDMHYTL